MNKPEQNKKGIEQLFDEDAIRNSQPFVHEYGKLMAYYRCAMMEIETKLNVLNEEFSLQYDRNPISNIKSRLKSPISIKEKLSRRNLPFTIEDIEENLNDVAGIRVICSFPHDVYMIANALLKQRQSRLIACFSLQICYNYLITNSNQHNFWEVK